MQVRIRPLVHLQASDFLGRQQYILGADNTGMFALIGYHLEGILDLVTVFEIPSDLQDPVDFVATRAKQYEAVHASCSMVGFLTLGDTALSSRILQSLPLISSSIHLVRFSASQPISVSSLKRYHSASGHWIDEPFHLCTSMDEESPVFASLAEAVSSGSHAPFTGAMSTKQTVTALSRMIEQLGKIATTLSGCKRSHQLSMAFLRQCSTLVSAISHGLSVSEGASISPPHSLVVCSLLTTTLCERHGAGTACV